MEPLQQSLASCQVGRQNFIDITYLTFPDLIFIAGVSRATTSFPESNTK